MGVLGRLLVSLSLLVASVAIAGETHAGLPAHDGRSAAALSVLEHGDCPGHADGAAASAEADACCAATALGCTGLTARAEAWALAEARFGSASRPAPPSTADTGWEPEGEPRPPRG
jgi:hypothetical protein